MARKERGFDSLDHKWILSVLRSYGIDPSVVRMIERLMSKWRSVLTVNGRKISDPIPIKSGILQGDSLSPPVQHSPQFDRGM